MSDSEEEEEEEDVTTTSNTKKEAVMLKIDTGIQADIHDNEESDPLPTVSVTQKSNTSSTQTNFRNISPIHEQFVHEHANFE